MRNDIQHCTKQFTQRVIRWILIGTVLNIMLSEISAQELTPRAYWPTPKGTKVAVAGYSYSFGDVLTDPSLPLAGLDSRIHVDANRWVFKTELGYMIPLAGRHALKAGFSMGVATESGGDFKSFLLSYQLLWY